MTDFRQCRFCKSELTTTFVDLGQTPLANSYLTAEEAAEGRDKLYPLKVYVCGSCFLAQAEDPVSPEAIFSDYAYFSSYSDSWVAHARLYADAMTERFGLSSSSRVVEIASNDGYLLQHFVAKGIPVLGIEPAANVAEVARARGVATDVAFFGRETARRLASEGISADLMTANNVLAHVPDIADFVAGFPILLTPDGVATFEFPHLLNLIAQTQFDTIYHEHYSYLSLVSVEKVLASARLRVFDVEEWPTHGGSLRVFACHEAADHVETARLRLLREKESVAKLDDLSGYAGFAERVDEVKASFKAFLAEAKLAGKTIAAYGAAAKGNTFLNVCGITREDIGQVFDRSLAKQGKLLPGSHIPVLSPDEIRTIRPDYLVILPWNLSEEICASLSYISEWGGQFVVAVPQTRVL